MVACENELHRFISKTTQIQEIVQLLGMMMALHGGPSLACINPTIHHYLLTDSIDESIIDCPLQVDDIPLNTGTSDLITLIEEVTMFVGLMHNYNHGETCDEHV